MKANEAPEKIYFSQLEDGRQYFTPAIPFEREFVVYVSVDAFIEKADEFISTFFHPDDTELIDAVLNRFHEHMKLK